MTMNIFINNIKTYLDERKLRQNYVSLITGWSTAKVSRILKGESGISDEDKTVLAEALGFDVRFFMGNNDDMKLKPQVNSQLAFFAGDVTEEEKKTASSLVDMFRFYDSIVNLQM